MKAGTLVFEFSFGWFGIGVLRTGLFPGFAAGPVRVSWVRGTLGEAIKAAVGRSPAP